MSYRCALVLFCVDFTTSVLKGDITDTTFWEPVIINRRKCSTNFMFMAYNTILGAKIFG